MFAGYLAGMAVAGWLRLQPAGGWQTHSHGAFLAALGVDVCTALTVEGLTGLVRAPLPLRFMDGEALFKAG